MIRCVSQSALVLRAAGPDGGVPQPPSDRFWRRWPRSIILLKKPMASRNARHELVSVLIVNSFCARVEPRIEPMWLIFVYL